MTPVPIESIKVESLGEEELKDRHVLNWPIWEKEVSTFDWTYETVERCYFLEGKVKVHTPEGTVDLQKGDFVTFPANLSCRWEITEPVRKHYQFG